MKTVIIVLAYATLASTTRDKRSYTHSHAVPLSVHTVVRPSNTLPVYEYPESTQIDTHSRTVYSVSVPITHTVHLEQPGHSRQVIYHNPPAIPSYHPQATYSSYTPQYTVPQYTPQYTVPQYTPHYTYTPHVQRRVYYARSQPWVYRRYANTWC